MTKLITSPDAIGIYPSDFINNPGVIHDIHEDVLRDLMQTSHAIERPRINERGDADHPRRRTCV